MNPVASFRQETNYGQFGNIENLIFQTEDGEWTALLVSPETNEVVQVKMNYNPWTGEELSPVISEVD